MKSQDVVPSIQLEEADGDVLQQKTHRPVQFEITPATREVVEEWIQAARLRSDDYLFPSRFQASLHLGTRQYARIVDTVCAQYGQRCLASLNLMSRPGKCADVAKNPRFSVDPEEITG